MFQTVLLLAVQLLIVSTSFKHIPHTVNVPVSNSVVIISPTQTVTIIPTMLLTPTSTLSPSLTPTDIPTHTNMPTPIPQPTSIQTSEPSLVPTRLPTSIPKPTAVPVSSLLSSVNSYRSDNGLGNLSSHATLCSIAGERLEQLKNRGSLDNHEGFAGYTSQLSSEFSSWHEVIFQSSSELSSDMVVRQGWANSPPHKASLLSAESIYGCGKTGNGFAVFLLTSPQ